MKMRSGFVSNSSSSSFCILGVEVDSNTYDIISSQRYSKDRKTLLDAQSGISCEDQYIIGFYPGKMKDDETLGQFKDRIVSEAARVGITVDKNKIDWYIDGGYNG